MVIFPLTIEATPDIFPPLMEFRALERPVNMAFTATPTRMILRGLKPPFHDRLYTRKKASTPPKKANSGVKKNNVGAKAVISTATKLAPLEIPMIPGSASGFLSTA